MCRWLAYSGSPILLDDILYKPSHSLIDQSLHSTHGVQTTNGDGFGIGWYGDRSEPALYKAVEPAWNDRNLVELSRHVRSPLVFAHVRASTGTPVQQSNCHPFRHGRWLWMHNGMIGDFARVKRDLVLAIDPGLFPLIEGSSDTEIFFYLALSFGLDDDPPSAVERAVGFIEQVGKSHGVESPMRMSVAVSDGESIWAFRYASVGEPPSLFYSTEVESLRRHYPQVEIFRTVSEETRMVVSEPLGERPGTWNEVPPSSYGVIKRGQDELRPFLPRAA